MSASSRSRSLGPLREGYRPVLEDNYRPGKEPPSWAEVKRAASAGYGRSRKGAEESAAPPAEGFGRMLAERRRSLGLSQPELAKRAGCSKDAVASIETGRANGRPGMRSRLLAALEQGPAPERERPSPPSVELGESIERRRTLLGWSQKRLAREARCSGPMVGLLERAQSRGSKKLRARIEEALSRGEKAKNGWSQAVRS